MKQQESFPVTLLFPCARGCGLSCFSGFVMDDKDGSYEAFTLQRGDDNTMSIRREVRFSQVVCPSFFLGKWEVERTFLWDKASVFKQG